MEREVVGYLDRGELPLSQEAAERLYRAMARARFFDEKAVTLQRQGRLGVYPPHRGQEAAQVGLGLALGPRDWVVPSYRENALLLTVGVPMRQLILLWRTHPEGWRFPPELRVLNPFIPIATQIPQAAGLALAARYQEEPWVVATAIGDGGTSEGDFAEGLNFAAVFELPLVILVQNNGYAISVPRERQMKNRYVAERAEGFGIPAVVVDGNDAVAVYLEARWAVERARRGEGPTLIEALTYRLGPHTTSDDPRRYRDPEEEARARERDTLPRLRRALEERGWWDEAKEAEWTRALEEELAQALEEADALPPPRPEEIVEHVYAELAPDQRMVYDALKAGKSLEEAWRGR